ncbi:MAG: GNAT family N-acetyltransferase [Myxococcales bacterium]|nr:GNAT family N-acetyltransferase [Myxococcales bacterium]
MPSDIVETRPATPEEWDRAWERCAYATYFHSRAWAELWERYTGGRIRPAPLAVRFADGQEVLLPWSIQRVARMARRLVWSPGGTYGGWLGAESVTAAHASTLAGLALGAKNIVWRVNPFDPHRRVLDGVSMRADHTHALDLSSGFEALEAAWRNEQPELLRKIRKAQRSGLAVEAARSERTWRDYYAAYEESLVRWGKGASAAYGWPLFADLMGSSSGDVRLWVALSDGAVAAGALCFYARRHAVYWHGAARASFFPQRPANLLMHTIIHDAAERGLDWFDFNPSGGHEGVERFKRSFGAQPLASPVILRESFPLRLARRLRGRR